MRTLTFLILLFTAVFSPAFAQDIGVVYTLSEAEIADKIAIDDFRVKSMQSIIANTDPAIIREKIILHLSDKTKKVINFQDNYVLIEYSSADGRIYTWLPDQNEVTTGTWNIQESGSGELSVCF